jgi:hypothetical protein
MIPKSGHRFSEKIMLVQKPERSYVSAGESGKQTMHGGATKRAAAPIKQTWTRHLGRANRRESAAFPGRSAARSVAKWCAADPG